MISARELKAAVDPVRIIGESVRLRKVGKRHVGLCPFHSEKTPSFGVNAEGVWHCFGCGKGGDIYDFIELRDGVDFRGAFRQVAAIAGIPIDSRDTYEEPSWALKLSGNEVRAFDRFRSSEVARLLAFYRFLEQPEAACMALLEGLWNAPDEALDAEAVQGVHKSLNWIHEAKALIDEQIERLETDPSFIIEPFLRNLYGNADFRAEVQSF